MNFTSRIRLNTKIAAPMRPAMITCAGFSCVASDSCSARPLMPRNDQNTAFATFSGDADFGVRSEEHTSELQSRPHLVCRLLLEKKKHQIAARNLCIPHRYHHAQD